MKFLELKYNGKVFKNLNEINQILKEKQFNWLIDSELERASIEIKKDTLIWHDGDFRWGIWHYGIFKNGNFFGGIWENGIWEGGNFSEEAKWNSGIKM